MKANIGIGENERERLGGILNALLADEFVLYAKTPRFHWNVVGSDFGELHNTRRSMTSLTRSPSGHARST